MNNTNIETGKITIDKLIERDGNTCYICGIRTSKRGGCYDPKYPNIEHVHPRSLGGEDAWYNVKVACRDCNVRKNNIPLEEFLKRKNIKREIKVTVKNSNSTQKKIKNLELELQLKDNFIETLKTSQDYDRKHYESLSRIYDTNFDMLKKSMESDIRKSKECENLKQENTILKKELEKYKNINIVDEVVEVKKENFINKIKRFFLRY